MRLRRFAKRLNISQTLVKSLKEFLSKSDIHSYHYMVEPNRHILERLMWMFLHLGMTVVSIYLVLFAWSRFTENPTVTNLESQHYSIYNLKFPAVAICPNNKISKRYAEEYADFLMTLKSLPKNYRSKDKLVNLIRYMGRLYDNDIDGIDEFVSFQEVLDLVDSGKGSKLFNAKEKLARLAPKCNDFIMKCAWAGTLSNCSEMIEFRETSDGFCCTFNYVKPTARDQKPRITKKPAGIGPTMGLTILMNLSRSDYFYQLKNYIGATALIFDPEEFAEMSTGGVREVPIEPFQELRIALKISTKIAGEEVQRYSIAKRGCMFPNDLLDEYNGNYLYGDCLMKCKLRSVIALCKCRMFNFPFEFFDDTNIDLPFCSLSNVDCLNKYRIKWQTYRPREMIDGLDKEFEDALNCETCYPLCSSTTYISDSTSNNLNFFYENKGAIIANMNESLDLSVLKVYFTQVDSVLYTTTVLYSWYDIVSEYGGILSLCLGCSIISLVEVIYFFSVRFYQNLFNTTTFMEKFNGKPRSNMFDVRKVYRRSKFEYIE